MGRQSWREKGYLKQILSFTWGLQSEKKAIALFFAMLLVFMVIVFGRYIVESTEHLLALNQELTLKKQLLINKEENLAAMAVNSKALLMFSDIERQKIHPDTRLPYALAHVSELMEACNITEMEFLLTEKEHIDVEPLDSANELVRVKIKTNGLGTYSDTMNYIDSLMSDDFYYHIDGVTMTSRNVTVKELISSTMEVSVFVQKVADENGDLGWSEDYEKQDRENQNPFYYDEMRIEMEGEK